MSYRSVRQQAMLALLLGSAFFTVTQPIALATTLTTSVSATVPPALMLAKHWPTDSDPMGFLVSEKLDGVRAFWDGHALRSRSGRHIAAPDWFTEALPSTALDGELWLGRGHFDRLSGIVRRNVPVDAEWREVRYMIFDLPGQPGRFDERAARIVSLTRAKMVSWLQAVEQLRIPDRDALQSQLLQIVNEGGEGLMLHRADAEWRAGRSDALRKLKPLSDEDARVVAYLPGKGRHTGRLGALLMELPNGQRFALGTGLTDAQREDPPALGTWVTYRYRDRTPTGLPRFASFLRVREAE